MDYKILGYTEKWFDYGFLDSESLEQQLKKFQDGGDKNTEHYRYGTFKRWITNKTSITDTEIENFFELVKQDSDQIMAGSALMDLISCSFLSDEQFDKLKVKAKGLGDWTTKHLIKQALLRRLKREGLSEKLFDECVTYSKTHTTNELIEWILRTDNVEFIERFTSDSFSKNINRQAVNRIRAIRKSKT